MIPILAGLFVTMISIMVHLFWARHWKKSRKQMMMDDGESPEGNAAALENDKAQAAIPVLQGSGRGSARVSFRTALLT